MKLIDQQLQRHLLPCPAGEQLMVRRCQLIEQTRLAISAGIEAEVPQRALALRMQEMGIAQEQAPNAEVLLQRRK